MVVVTRSVHIAAPVERVFALMADPAARSRLSPHARPIRVEIEDGGPLRLGSVCHFRLELGGRIVDYRTRVREFEPNRLIVSVSDTAIPFETRIETVPEEGGTRLTQTERFEPDDETLRAQLPDDLDGKLLRLAYAVALLLDAEWARRLRRQQEEMIEAALGARLERWLAAIKEALECPSSAPAAAGPG
jgi:uncharacterized protein YndB with AHSA1/START domain